MRSPHSKVAAAPLPAVPVFWFLQALDVLTTLLGLRLGASEANIFLLRAMSIGIVPALLIVKGLALLMGGAALMTNRTRWLKRVNYWFAAVVSWNFAIIFCQAFGR